MYLSVAILYYILYSIRYSVTLMSTTHSHKPVNYNIAFIVGLGLNILFVLVELWFGYISHSLALTSDAVHNATDVFGLLIAWAGLWFANRTPNKKHTYGLGRGSILTSLFNAILIFVAAGGIFVEAFHRFNTPTSVMGATIIWVAIIGIIINGITAFLFMKGRKKDINIRGAFIHMAIDAGVSFGVVLAGILITFTGLPWLDPLVSMIIGLIIILTTWSLMRESLNLALDAVPESINVNEVKEYLESLKGVVAVHDLHIWAISTKETGLTAHLIQSDIPITYDVIQEATDELHNKFHIGHSTLQVEKNADNLICKLESDNII